MGHVNPEAMDGLPIAVVDDGDIVSINTDSIPLTLKKLSRVSPIENNPNPNMGAVTDQDLDLLLNN